MAFPTTPLLDSFTRANENPLDNGTWGGQLFQGDGNLILTSNQVGGSGSGSGNNQGWLTQVGPDCEVYASIANISGEDSIQVMARWSALGTTTADGYGVRAKAGATNNLLLLRFDAGVLTAVLATMPQTVENGDWFGMRLTGSTIEVFYKDVSVADEWFLLDSVTDATHGGAGHLGLYTFSVDNRVDNFSGGLFVPAGGVSLFRGRSFPFFDDEQVNRFEFWPAVSSGGQTFTLNLAGSVSPSALLVDTASKTIAGSVAPSSAVMEQANKALSGSDTPLGDLLRRANSTLAAALDVSGGLSNQGEKALIGEVSPTGVSNKQPSQILLGITSPSGSLFRQIVRFISGSVTPTSSIASIKIVLLSLIGAVSPSGLVIKESVRLAAGSIDTVGSLFHTTLRSLAGVVSPSGSLAQIKIILLSLIGSILPSGVLMKQGEKAIAASLSTSAALLKQADRVLAGVIGPSASVANLRIILLALTGSVSPDGVLAKSLSRTVEGMLSLEGTLSRLISAAFSGGVSSSGALAKSITRILSGILSPAGIATNVSGVVLRIIKQPTSVKLSGDGKLGTSISVNSGDLDTTIDS